VTKTSSAITGIHNEDTVSSQLYKASRSETSHNQADCPAWFFICTNPEVSGTDAAKRQISVNFKNLECHYSPLDQDPICEDKCLLPWRPSWSWQQGRGHKWQSRLSSSKQSLKTNPEIILLLDIYIMQLQQTISAAPVIHSPSFLSVTGLGAPLSSSLLKRRYISLQNEWMNEWT